MSETARASREDDQDEDMSVPEGDSMPMEVAPERANRKRSADGRDDAGEDENNTEHRGLKVPRTAMAPHGEATDVTTRGTDTTHRERVRRR
jgi:hypothetical protein